MHSTTQAELERYERGPAVLRAAVAGLGARELEAFPVPGTWSIRQIVVHLLDSDMAATHRMRRIVAEEMPLLIAYDETAFAAKLDATPPELELVLRLFEDNRRFTAGFLRGLPAEAFARAGIHNQRGKVTLAEFVTLYANHVEHHVKFIAQKRAMLGKPA